MPWKQAFLLALALGLLLAGTLLAMPDEAYHLDWVAPMTGSGGPAASAHYAVDITIGQAASGSGQSDRYALCLGFWCGAERDRTLFLPAIRR